MCDPTGGWLIGLSIVSAGLGVAQSVAGYQQAQSNVAYENAVAEQNYQFSMMQTSAQRGFEQMREQQQEAMIQQNDFFARQAYSNDIAQLNSRFMQEQEAAAMAKAQTAKRGLEARGEIQAAGRIGNTVDNLIADYYRQQAAFDFVTDRNLGFAGTQIQQQKKGVAAELGSRLGSVQPYIKQPMLDPLKPIPKAAPSALPYVLGGVGSVVGAASSALSAGVKTPSPGGGGGGTFSMPSGFSTNANFGYKYTAPVFGR